MSSVIGSEKDVLVKDHPSKKSFYSRITEDGWALWIGGLLMAAVLLIAFSMTDFKFASQYINGQVLMIWYQRF